jgi:hypothetical protein
MRRSVIGVRLLVLPLLVVLLSACGTPEDPSVVTVGPSLSDGYVPVTETFDGTLVAGGSNLHTFHAMPGPVKITLVSVNPADAPVIAFGIGMWDGITCQLVFQQPAAIAASELTGTASIDSNVCLKVWDPGTLATDATVKYQMSAVHNEVPAK